MTTTSLPFADRLPAWLRTGTPAPSPRPAPGEPEDRETILTRVADAEQQLAKARPALDKKVETALAAFHAAEAALEDRKRAYHEAKQAQIAAYARVDQVKATARRDLWEENAPLRATEELLLEIENAMTGARYGGTRLELEPEEQAALLPAVRAALAEVRDLQLAPDMLARVQEIRARFDLAPLDEAPTA